MPGGRLLLGLGLVLIVLIAAIGSCNEEEAENEVTTRYWLAAPEWSSEKGQVAVSQFQADHLGGSVTLVAEGGPGVHESFSIPFSGLTSVAAESDGCVVITGGTGEHVSPNPAACSFEVFPYHGLGEIGWPWFQWRAEYGLTVTVYADSDWVINLDGLAITDEIQGNWIEYQVP